MDQVLGEILPYLTDASARALKALPDFEQLQLREIRIRADGPMLLRFGFGRRICNDVVFTKEQIESVFRKICASSAYSHRNEIRSGFVTILGGHRVGIVGTAVLGEGEKIEGMRDIRGLSFRVAREYDVSLREILPTLIVNGRIRNLMLLGPPCSGKTTVLRAVAKELSKTVQVAVVDEREELFPVSRSVPVGCDVLRGYPKAVGILQAVRTLSPDVVVCDEIGTADEVCAMMDGLRSGVSLLVSAHAYSAEELMQRPPVRKLFFSGGIDAAVFLDPRRAGTVCDIKEREDLCAEMRYADSDISALRGVRGDLRS